MEGNEIKRAVRERYGQAAEQVRQSRRATCCGPASSCCGGSTAEVPPTALYSFDEASSLPAEAVLASLGCGNPTALAELRAGEVVLDLGSGGGIDVLLSARRVGPTGKAYGLDMTDEMLALARENQDRAGVKNVEFLRGEIESIPLPDNTVDVIISNCVINLSADKDKVLREAYRVLKPGGRFAVSDIVLARPLSPAASGNLSLWCGCVAGALTEADYRARLERAGFTDAGVEHVRQYLMDDIADKQGREFVETLDEAVRNELKNVVFSAFVRARKPV